MKKLFKVFVVLSFLFVFSNLVLAGQKTESNAIPAAFASDQSVMSNSCLATYNFLTGIMRVPCAEVSEKVYWLDLKLNQKEDGSISLDLVDAGENTDYSGNEGTDGFQCPEGTEYDEAKGTCVADGSQCPEGTEYDEDKGTCVANNVQCPEGTEYDEAKGTCVADGSQCPEGTVYDTGKVTCVAESSK